MTAAFNEFLRQYNLTGREKADGYSPDVFIGLDEIEKQQVFDLLLTEISISVKWLFYLNPEKALFTIKQTEAEWRGESYRRVFSLQEEIIQHTGDLTYQEHMIEDYQNYAESLKPLAIDSLGRTPDTVKKINFLKNIILTETNEDAVFRASERLLDSLKLPRDNEKSENDYQITLDHLNSERTENKLKALSGLKYYEENLDF